MSPLATVRRSLGPPEDAALLPHMWLRKQWLTHALRNYPVYDPPHKVEERLLPKEQALENFDYFMRVRQGRVAYFQKWLRRYFWTDIWADDKGVRALNRWARRYSGLVFLGDLERRNSYYTYDPPWTGAGAGCNVVFDIGIALGEFIMVNCPKLRWDMDPISAVLPKTARERKRFLRIRFPAAPIDGLRPSHLGQNPTLRFIYACLAGSEDHDYLGPHQYAPNLETQSAIFIKFYISNNNQRIRSRQSGCSL